MSIQTEIEETLTERTPDVEVLLAEVVGTDVLRLFIDHPDGVTLEVCERVTHALPEVRERYALEVSSPGTERPLTKPEHFRRFVGHEAKVRLAEPMDGRRNFTGVIESAGENDFVLKLSEGGAEVELPFGSVSRAHLKEDIYR